MFFTFIITLYVHVNSTINIISVTNKKIYHQNCELGNQEALHIMQIRHNYSCIHLQTMSKYKNFNILGGCHNHSEIIHLYVKLFVKRRGENHAK